MAAAAHLNPTRFFTIDPRGGALLDRNGDGFPDGLRARLVIDGEPAAEDWIELIHLAARLGLETGGLDLPLAVPAAQAGELPPDTLQTAFHPAGTAGSGRSSASGPVLDGAMAVRDLWRHGFDRAEGEGEQLPDGGPPPDGLDLGQLYEIGGLYLDDDGDLFPERARLCIVVPPRLPVEVGCALLDFAARVGLETSGLRFPLAVAAGAPLPGDAVPLFVGSALEAPPDVPADAVAGVPAPGPGEGLCAVMPWGEGGAALLIRGDATGAAAALRELATNWPHLRGRAPGEPTVADLVDDLVRLAGTETEAGRAALLAAGLADLPAAASPGAELRLLDTRPALQRAAEAWAAESGSRLSVRPAGDDLLAFAEDWADEWEIDRARRIVRERVLPSLDANRPVELLVMVSEPAAVRRALADELTALVGAAGQPGEALPPGSTVTVLSAFKPGLCWLREVVAPRWRALGGVARVEVRYRPLLPAEDAMDAADAGEGAGERTGRRLDLPIRWLQELFPGDEVLAAALGLPLDAVRMVEGEPGDDETYVATCWDAAGRELDRLYFSPRSYTRPYLEGLPEQGWVIATTGAVVAAQGGRVVVDEPLPTDLDRFWDYYQGTVLPRARRLIEEETGGAPTPADQPFFAGLDVEVWASEPDELLGIRQELVSSAEALHEDIYFATLDYVAALGEQAPPSGTIEAARAGQAPLDAPGSVRPFVHVREGVGPRARVTLRRRARHLAELVTPGLAGSEERRVPVAPVPAGPRPQVAARWALWRAGERGVARLGLDVTGGGGLAGVLERASTQSPAGEGAPGEEHIAVSVTLPERAVPLDLSLPVPDVGYRADGSATAAPDATTQAAPAMPLDVVIGEDELPPLLRRLAALPGVGVRRVARSFEGRAVDAIEATAPVGAAVWSRLKAALYKPTLLVVGRHHANEVASTPAALRLVELCAADPAYRPLLDRVNLVALPFENPDGAALHYAMQREHPTWKLHAARYNAVGLEFAREFFKSDTPYGEARARPLFWRRWRPDGVADNHGVPSHEWNQLFSGFNSPPRFGVSYWVVQALLYGILRYPEDALDSPSHLAFAEALRDRIAAEVAADAGLLAANRVLRERHTTWGHSRLPDAFPAEYFGEMLWYFGPLPPGWRERSNQPPGYYRVTSANWVTEVADETAQGEYLALVARAHLVTNVAALRLMAEVAPPVERRVTAGPGWVQLVLRRQRPLPAPGTAGLDGLSNAHWGRGT